MFNNRFFRSITGCALSNYVAWNIWEYNFNFKNPLGYPIFSKLWLYCIIGIKPTEEISNNIKKR